MFAPGDAIRAVDVLNRMTGVYDQQHAAAVASARFLSLASRFRALMPNPTTVEPENVPKENLERKPNTPRRVRTSWYVDGMPVVPHVLRRYVKQLPPTAPVEPTVNAPIVTHDDADSGA